MGSCSTESNGIDSEQHCKCGLMAKIKISKTKRNPGRAFYGCRNYGEKSGCNYFGGFVDMDVAAPISTIMLALKLQKDHMKYMSEDIAVLETQKSELESRLKIMKQNHKKEKKKVDRLVVWIRLLVLCVCCLLVKIWKS